MPVMGRTVAVALPRNQPDFESFFLERRERLFGALWLVTHDRHEAEEIAQDAFLKLWERWERIGGLENPEAYLYRTAMNLYRNRRRRAALAVRRIVHLVPADEPQRQVDDRDEVVRALGTLTRAQRAAVVLIDLVGMSSAEAARALGVRPSTVRVLAARARTSVRERIGGSDE
jgi:RNA polymerase sigma-70 factor (ECF subfamily)